jgi:homoserine dehydrogenase
MVPEGEHGFTPSELESIVSGRRRGEGLVATGSPRETLMEIAASMPVIVMDASAGTGATDLLVEALDLGGGIVLSNKAPLALPSADSRTAALWSQAGPMGRLRYEATCGAGLPIISTLRSLLDTGDEMRAITGTVSGTFGAIFSAVGSGVPFSQAVGGCQGARLYRARSAGRP